MKSILIVLKVLIALIGVTLLYNGALWGFHPAGQLVEHDIEVSSLIGTNMIKTDIGAPLIAVGLIALLFVRRPQTWWKPVTLLAGSYAVVRAASLVVDGFNSFAFAGVVLEVLVAFLAVVIYRLDERLNNKCDRPESAANIKSAPRN